MRCKVGDLAVIVRADNDPECLGRVVKIGAPPQEARNLQSANN